MKDTIRVLVVDDSAVMRQILIDMLRAEPHFQIVGEAQDGLEAVQLTASLHPDVITMDIRMPRLNGLEATRYIMSTTPTPIVVVANNVYETDLNIAFNAIAAGALTVVEKPRGLDGDSYEAVADQLIMAVSLMSDVQVVALAPTGVTLPPLPGSGILSQPLSRVKVVAIAASTGGPGVLNQIVSNLPGDFPVPILVVQHITTGFGQGMAHWLNSLTSLKVSVAESGEQLLAGHVYLAPDDTHMTVNAKGQVLLDRADPVNGSRPSANRMFVSVAQVYGQACLGVILSGMGEDGVEGLSYLKRAGGYVIAQNEETCVVYGMPRAVVERGLADQVLPPERIITVLKKIAPARQSNPAFAK